MNPTARQAFRARAQTKREEMRPGAIVLSWHIDGALHTVNLDCAVGLSPVTPTPAGGGVLNVQTIRADIRKTLLPDRPSGGVVVTYGDLVFDHASSIAGDDPGAIIWTIRAQRIV